MSKYTPLKLHLQSQLTGEVTMSFDEVEAVLGFRLPNSAYRHRPWWANEFKGHVHAQAWLDAGYELAQVDMVGRKLVFRRIVPCRHRKSGMSDAARSFEGEVAMTTQRRHPAFGALKGTFTLAPGWDLTRPALDPEELVAWEANLERKAGMIERGVREKKA